MKRVLMLSTVASLQDQFNMANIRMLRNLHCDVHVACNFVQGNNTSPQRIAVFQNELAALGVTCRKQLFWLMVISLPIRWHWSG